MKLILGLLITAAAYATASAQVLGDPVDVSQDFRKMENVYFVGSRLGEFDAAAGSGRIRWDRYLLSTTLSFNKVDVGLSRGKATEFPGTEYDADPSLPFSISFVSPRTVRLRFNSRDTAFDNSPSLMLDGEPRSDRSWKVESTAEAITYTSAHGKVRIVKEPWAS